MSYFTPDVVAREQLPGATSTAAPVVGGDSARYYYPTVYPFDIREKRRSLLVTVRKLLQTLREE